MVGVRKSYWLPAAVLCSLILALADYNWRKLHLPVDWFMVTNIASFAWIVGLIVLSHVNQRFESSSEAIERFNAVMVVPVYNEDPVTFRAMLDSLDRQTRKPDGIVVVDDGSKTLECYDAFRAWRKQTSIKAFYIRQANRGKREAQAQAFRRARQASVYITVDSDTVLDEHAIEEGLKPFANPKVMGVAGLLLSLNDRANLLTRLVDLGFVSSFLNGRASWSAMHSLAVSCGGLAFYRGEIVRKYLDEYLNHTVLGVRSTCGDDRMLTNFALLEGWTVFQESAVGYTLLPTNLKHLTKQRIRWWRSFFWGSEWLLRRFSMRRLVWWLVAWQLISFVLYTVIMPVALIATPVVHHNFPALFFLYMFALSYARDMRYLSVKRPDQPYWQQLLTYLMAPLSTLLHMYLCTVLQYVGLATFHKMGWSTRAKVEVGLAPAN